MGQSAVGESTVEIEYKDSFYFGFRTRGNREGAV